jgi:epsilon-lactone hydrolase
VPSFRAYLLKGYARLVIRRRRWGDTPEAIARRARRLFQAPAVLQRLAARGLRVASIRDAGGVRGEWLSSPGAGDGVIVYVHGGGYVGGSAAGHRPLTAALARASRCHVVAVDYRLAPEFPCPAALDDVERAYRWLLRHVSPATPVAVAGESAGGGLVLALAQRLRDAADPSAPPPTCVVALSPWTDLTVAGASVAANDGRCDMLRRENPVDFGALYLGGRLPSDREASPLFNGGHGLPPTLFHVGSRELLVDDARRMHALIVAAGGESRIELFDRMPHAWHVMAPVVPEAAQAVRQIAAYIDEQFARRRINCS